MSNENIQNNDLQLLAIPQLMKKHFFIPDYQRGYRWEKSQIYQLLRDIQIYIDNGNSTPDRIGFYCLQPIVVKQCSEDTIQQYHLRDLSDIEPYDAGDEKRGPKNNVWYEVIDGQQRLTTIRILLAFYEEWHEACSPYELAYATRPELNTVFDHLIVSKKDKTAEISDIYEHKDIIDVQYISDCAHFILEWFADDNEVKKAKKISSFLEYFYQLPDEKLSVQVIWYETKEDTDARDIFERLNNLKVPLSSSELIRALFLSDTADYHFAPDEKQIKELSDTQIRIIRDEDRKKKQFDINSKWDEIEHFFHNTKLWGFLTKRSPDVYRNRIELLFDYISEKYVSGGKNKKQKEQRLYTYTWFDQHSSDLWWLWEKRVLVYYDTLRFWFENSDFYHKIGYLSHEQGDDVIVALLKEATNPDIKHRAFEKALNNRITASIKTELKFSELSYKDNYATLKSLLFLYNVEYTRKHSESEPWFPFDNYNKAEQKEGGWTLEHIHAQNSDCLDRTKKAEWRDWVKYTIAARESIPYPNQEEQELLKELKEKLPLLEKDVETEGNSITYEDIVELFQKDIDVWSGNHSFTVLHLLANLALLSQSVNSGIGKGSFSVKQQYINKCIADEKYIPICTKKVFLKHYYNQEDVKGGLLKKQLLVWSDSDRTSYLDSITETLSTYFSSDQF